MSCCYKSTFIFMGRFVTTGQFVTIKYVNKCLVSDVGVKGITTLAGEFMLLTITTDYLALTDLTHLPVNQMASNYIKIYLF